MDFQTLINLVGGAAIGAAGWFARRVWDAMDSLRADHSSLREELPKTYVSRDDFRESMREVKELLVSINNKLDRKLDKP